MASHYNFISTICVFIPILEYRGLAQECTVHSTQYTVHSTQYRIACLLIINVAAEAFVNKVSD